MKNADESVLDWTSPKMREGAGVIFGLMWEGVGSLRLPFLMPKDWMDRWTMAVSLAEVARELIEPILDDIEKSSGRRP